MSNTKFTKGPWVNDDLNISCGKIMDVAIVIGYDPDNTGFNICNECTSNAQLIAEAPELYKMVEQLTSELAFAIKEANLWRKRLINSTTENEPELLDGQTCHEAQVLLAKIRGES